MNVTACLVTRGDVDIQLILDSLPAEWEILVWDNGEQTCWIYEHGLRGDGPSDQVPADDLSVFGRYAAIEYATNDLIYVVDDDVIVSDPQAIVDEWLRVYYLAAGLGMELPGGIVCNQPPEFRHDFYSDHSLVGFGAAFHRDAPARAFERFERFVGDKHESPIFNRCCDIVFTGLTPCVRVDIPKENLPHAYADDRMWRQSTHQAERQRMLDLVRRVRDER